MGASARMFSLKVIGWVKRASVFNEPMTSMSAGLFTNNCRSLRFPS